MNNEDISICRKVIYETIFKLSQKEKNTEFESESFQYAKQRIVLVKALEILKE